MRAELFAKRRTIARGEDTAKRLETPVTPVTPVTLKPGYRSKAAAFQALQRLQAEASKVGKDNFPPVTELVPPPLERLEAIPDNGERRGAPGCRAPCEPEKLTDVEQAVIVKQDGEKQRLVDHERRRH